LQDATVYQEFTANLEGQQNVEIRPKVSGFIQNADEGQVRQLSQTKPTKDAAKAMVSAALSVDRQTLVDRNIISNAPIIHSHKKSAYGDIAAILYGTILFSCKWSYWKFAL
jgi:membrane fusion protein (multidrug efflux system)